MDSGRFVHQPVNLSPGANRFVLMAGDSMLQSWEIWYRPAGPEDEYGAPGVRRFLLHGDSASALCERCHAGVWQPGPGVPARLGTYACFGCHRTFDRAPFRHGPAAGWLCAACHRSGEDWRLDEVPAPTGPLCLSCHADLAARIAAASVAHGPAAGGYCTVCHDPHASERRVLLPMPPSALCGTCHVRQADGKHIIGWTGSERAHPVAGLADPREPSRELTCTSCHDPHGAGTRYLFREARSVEELCHSCHRDARGRR